jgi:protein-export chaperone SecB
MADEANNGAEAPAAAQFMVHKLYLKNVSYEAPGAPAVFQEQAMPQLQLNLNQKVGRFEADMYEVVLSITLTCTINEKTAYLAEVEQAGIFGLTGFERTLSVRPSGARRPDRAWRIPAIPAAASEFRGDLRRSDAAPHGAGAATGNRERLRSSWVTRRRGWPSSARAPGVRRSPPLPRATASPPCCGDATPNMWPRSIATIATSATFQASNCRTRCAPRQICPTPCTAPDWCW